jgi:hypothetical protein
MNYLTDFLNRKKNESLDNESRLNRLNPDFDEKKLQTPDNESRLNRLNPEREYSETPPIPPADGLIRRGEIIVQVAPNALGKGGEKDCEDNSVSCTASAGPMPINARPLKHSQRMMNGA